MIIEYPMLIYSIVAPLAFFMSCYMLPKLMTTRDDSDVIIFALWIGALWFVFIPFWVLITIGHNIVKLSRGHK